MKTVLVTGANGFVGSHIVDQLLAQGYAVRAMVRSTSNLRWLEGREVEYAHASLDDLEGIRQAAEGVEAVVHNAGVVSAANKYHYYLHNTEGTRRVVDAVKQAGGRIKRFVFVSSQAAEGPTRSAEPRSEEQTPEPITDYGRSKLLAENLIRERADKLPWTVVRPPSVYGPRDDAFLPFFKLVRRGWMPSFGAGREVSFVHAGDLARQVVLQLEKKEAVGEIFHAAPFPPVSLEEFGKLLGRALGSEPRTVSVPDALLRYGYPLVYPLLALLPGKPPFRPDKLPDFLTPRWTISGEKAAQKLGMEGAHPLAKGVEETAAWYRERGWLPA